jgi:transposase
MVVDTQGAVVEKEVVLCIHIDNDLPSLRARLAQRGIELICPYRKNNQKRKYHDGRKLRRYKRRWTVERTFAWLQNFRRLVVRWDRKLTIYQGFFHLACLLITLRQF